MGTVAAVLPLILEALKLAPTLATAGMEVYEGAKKIWEAATSEEEPTPEERRAYDDAEAAAFAALMESTKDVAEEDDR